MPLVEDPAHLSKTRLKSDLVAHNVELPPAASKKEVYVELHLKNIDQKYSADFSSDEEDPVQDVADNHPENPELPDPHSLTDNELKATLLKYGVKAGPIIASTRSLYERKLRKVLQSKGHEELNGVEKTGLYSDTEEEDGNEEGDEESEQEQEETVRSNQRRSTEAELHFQKGDFAYQQCFLLSSRLRACPSRSKQLSSKWNSRNAFKSSERPRSRCSQIPAGISSSISQRQGLRSGAPSGSQSVMHSGCISVSTQAFSIAEMVEEMESRSSLSASVEKELNSSDALERYSWSNRLDKQVMEKNRSLDQSLYYTPRESCYAKGMKPPEEPLNEILKDIFADTKTTPTGIYATSRRPIKGAAQRPIKYSYPDTPVSPLTLERQELEHRLVPIKIQILVFFIVMLILYFIYVHVEDSGSVLTLLDSLVSDDADGILFQDETLDTYDIGQE